MSATNILIIEDNPISRKVVKVALEVEHYTVAEAIDGASGLDLAANQSFDLIIQDLFLPDMDGFALNKKLRGLPTVKDIPIFALSGFLSLLGESDKSGFTTFLLKPVAPLHLISVVKAHLHATKPSVHTVGKGKKILIADDNPIQLKLFAMQLRNVGFEVTTALDGVIALKEAINQKPDIIISDVLMPNLDGFSLCLEIKRDPKLCTIPVILLTSHYLENEDLVLADSVGASRYLTRVPDEEKLINEVLNMLNLTSSDIPVIPIEVTKDIKEMHMMRSIRQLEQQVLDNSQLALRCSMLMSQLALIDGIANALTSSTKDIEQSLKEVLYYCLDATGISKGALYLKKPNGIMALSQQVGYHEDQIGQVKSLFGISTLIPEIIKENKIFVLRENISSQKAFDFLFNANVKSAIFVPLFSGTKCMGILFLGSDMNNLLNTDNKEFARTLGMQFGQSIALASAFENVSSSEKRYRQLVEISPDAILIQQDGVFVYANKAALTLLDTKSQEELLTHSIYEYIHLDYRHIIKNYIQEQKTQESKTLVDIKVINLKGDILDVEIVVSPITFHDNPAIYMIMRDITDRKRSALHLEIQYEIAWILAESPTLYVATIKILKIICERLKWDCGAIWAVDKEANVLRCTRDWQIPDLKNASFHQESQNLSFASGEGLPGQVWKNRNVIWKSDVLEEDSFLRITSVAQIGLNTAVGFPIIYEGEVLGVIEFYSTKTLQPNYDLLLWFESIGNQFGMFLVRKHMEKQMLHLAEHDALTGLSNRNLLEQYLNTALDNAKENQQKLAILFLDLDHFKYINDSMGHQAGDHLLKEVSHRFSQCLRPQDTISRLGGDEFVIVIPNIQHDGEIVVIIDRLQNELSKEIILNEKEFTIKASIGVSFYPKDGTTVPALMKGADIAMYAAKEKGRNNYQFCNSEMTTKAENRIILQNDLRSALENNEFILFYQPKIDIKTQSVNGMEALIRWKRPNTLLLPGSFISAAESSDFIIPLGEWVFKTSCMQNKVWQDAKLPPVTVSVNLSVKNLNKQLLQVVENTFTETKVIPSSMEVELTESALMENVDNNIQVLRSLKDMGLKISIDDFGTGYSSLSYLKRFPIDVIKIDKSFVRDIATDPDDAAIVKAIITMSHSLNFKVIAEGVETLAQLKFLCDHGCDEIQGFYFSRPLPLSEATHFLKSARLDTFFDKSSFVA